MKKKLLLIMMALVATFATMNAQDESERTETPWFDTYNDGTGVVMTIYHEDDDAVINWRYSSDEGETWTDWMVFVEPVVFTNIGMHYCVEAYAVSPGKAPSYTVYCYFEVEDPNEMYHRQIADFGVDGIYYKISS